MLTPRPSLKISLPIESSRQAGLASSTLANALTRRWPKGERLIAEALDVAPEKTGPSRYR
ncbi:TPA: helix-turn-helix domain-containing protein [Raoultella ornithinolytica]|nr:helix-turn-helix domain-containing protein [Raoultella ornithinolytica]